MKVKEGHLLDHSVVPYPRPLVTLLAPPDRLPFDLTERTHAHTEKSTYKRAKVSCLRLLCPHAGRLRRERRFSAPLCG